MSRTIAGLMLAATLLFGGCGFDKNKGIFMAAGSYGDLAVVVSSDEIRPIADRFLAGFNITSTFIIKEEPHFNPDVFTPANSDLAKGYKNSLFIIRIGDGGDAEKAARKHISKEAWEKLKSGGGGIVQLNDPWSSYQLAIVVASRDRNSLGSILANNTERIRDLFEQSNRERILRRNRYEGLNTLLINANWDRFGFFMEVPGQYAQNQLQPGGFPGLEMMRNAPSRGISVSWLETDDPAWLLAEQEALLMMRQEMGRKLHNEDVVPESVFWSEAEIGGTACVKLEGAWNSRKFAGGGAFWTYFIPDAQSGRVFCVDLLVYAPGMDKMQFFRQMNAVASTFSTQQPQP